jgi:hypothetical protein
MQRVEQHVSFVGLKVSWLQARRNHDGWYDQSGGPHRRHPVIAVPPSPARWSIIESAALCGLPAVQGSRLIQTGVLIPSTDVDYGRKFLDVGMGRQDGFPWQWISLTGTGAPHPHGRP